MFTISRFASLIKLLPRGVFDRAVREERADRYRKRFSTWDQLLAMIYGQLSGVRSLRTLTNGFNAQEGHHYHLGCGAVRRSTLAQANAHGAVSVFAQLAQALLLQARGKLRQEAGELVRLLDSTSITLKGRGFDEWTEATRTRNTQGVKLHLLLGLGEGAPLEYSISAANVNDIEYGRTLSPEAGVVYVFDKGYCDYRWWWQIEQRGAKFVTRFKRNARVEVLKERTIAQAARGTILSDEWVKLSNKHPGGARRNPYVKPLRRIVVAREGKDPMVLATNDLKSSALRIAERYRQRWQIELFFKWIKQHLRIKSFLGRSENAVRIQILTALITYLLLALYAKAHRWTGSLHLLLNELRSTLFQRPQLELHRHRRWREKLAFIASHQTELFAGFSLDSNA
jgi:putative transposase